MKKRLGLFIAGLAAVLIALPPALAGASVNYNRLIDDFVFSNKNKMSAAQIDAFLNSFSNSCISTNKGFKAPDPTGYNPTDGFLYGSNVSAGKVIYDAAQAYDLNPQVLLATLQKEQGYVSGPGFYDCTSPLTSSAKKGYTQAMGYGCPDGGTTYSYSGVNLYTIGSTTVTSVSGTCVNSKSKAGFAQQMIHAAWLLKFGQQRSLGNTGWAVIRGNWDNSDDPDSCYGGPMTQGNRKRCDWDTPTFYDGYTTIDSSSVHMDTGATASLYWYTPHKSGNSHFVSIFTGWFGSTLSNPIKLTYIDSHSSESGGTAVVEYSLVQQPSDNVIIPLAVTDSTEAALGATNSLTITPANWNKPESNKVTVTGVDDNDSDGDIHYDLIAGNPSSNDPAYDNLSSTDAPNAALTNDDNEPDITLIGDWDGDGKDEIGLKRGNTYYMTYDGNGTSEAKFDFGAPDDTPLVGDWDGDGKDDIGLKRGGRYYFNYDRKGTTAVKFDFGVASDTPLVGDWNGDGQTDIGLRRGHRYYLNYDHKGTTNAKFDFGDDSDTVLVGNWDGNRTDNIGLKRGGRYYLNFDNHGATNKKFDFGVSADITVVGDWDGNRTDNIGLKRGARFYLNYDDRGTTNTKFDFGQTSDIPLTGDWDGDHKSEIGLKRSNKYYLNYDNNGTAEATFYFGR